MRETKIMATLADNRATAEFVARMRAAGMDSVRINSAHVDADGLRRLISLVRSVDSGIAILMDTKGPELRTTDVAEPFLLAEGDEVMLAYGSGLSTPGSILTSSAPDIAGYVAPADLITIDDGAIALEAIDDCGRCRVVRGGLLGSRKTLVLADGKMPPLPPVSERDRINILAGCQAGIDMIAHSFVRSEADVEAVRELLSGSDVRLYAKIECRPAIENMEAIAREADGLLVARGDLGTAIDICRVPVVQYDVLRLCRRMGKDSIVATQILQSMMTADHPTRAEVSDIAMAVAEGAGTLLLCGETAQGAYPVECVEVMRRAIESAESRGLRGLLA